MVLNRKAQGLPINTIILIAIGLLILVLLITFVLGGFKGLGAGASPASSGLSAFQSECSTYASGIPSTAVAQWCTYTTPNPSGTGYYNCYSDLSMSPGASNVNSTQGTLTNGSTIGYNSVTHTCGVIS